MADIGPLTRAALERCRRGTMKGGAQPTQQEITKILTDYRDYLDLIRAREQAEELPPNVRDEAVAAAIESIKAWKADHPGVDWNRSYRSNRRAGNDRVDFFLRREVADTEPPSGAESMDEDEEAERSRQMAERIQWNPAKAAFMYAPNDREPFQDLQGSGRPWKGQWMKHPRGGGVPHDDAYQQAARQAYDREIHPIGDYEPVFQSDTLKAWKSQSSNDLLVGVRGTVGVGDLPANASLPFNRLGETERYKADERSLKRLLQKYPGAQVHFASHSLGSAVARRLEDAIPTASSRGFNPAFEASAFLKPGKQQRIYSGDDFLSKVGKYLPGAQHVPSAVQVPDAGIKTFDPSTWRTVKQHSMDSFKPIPPKQRSRVPLGMPTARRRGGALSGAGKMHRSRMGELPDGYDYVEVKGWALPFKVGQPFSANMLKIKTDMIHDTFDEFVVKGGQPAKWGRIGGKPVPVIGNDTVPGWNDALQDQSKVAAWKQTQENDRKWAENEASKKQQEREAAKYAEDHKNDAAWEREEKLRRERESNKFENFAKGAMDGVHWIVQNAGKIPGIPKPFAMAGSELSKYLQGQDAGKTLSGWPEDLRSDETVKEYSARKGAEVGMTAAQWLWKYRTGKEYGGEQTSGGVRVRHPKKSRHRRGGIVTIDNRHNPQGRTRETVKQYASVIRPTAQDPYRYRTAEGMLAAQRSREIVDLGLVSKTLKTAPTVTIASAINPMFL